MKTCLAALAALCAFTMPGNAAEPDWKSVVNGVDGVIVYCHTTTSQSYAGEICKGIDSAIVSAFSGAPLRVVSNGMISVGDTNGSGESADPEPLKHADGMKRPLLIRIFVKGTDDNTPAIYIGVRVAIAYAAATDAGSIVPPKAGDLVFEERSFVASGPRKKLPGVLVGHVGKDATELVGRIRAGL